ncbi:aldo/keto reductase, partial [candidate division KSB1 bacterium]
MANTSFSRRDFLKKSSIGMASIAAFKDLKRTSSVKSKQSNDKIIYRKLGKTGIKLPIVNMGVMNADNPAVLKRAYELGVRHFDTAWRYGENNEKIVGQVINEL